MLNTYAKYRSWQRKFDLFISDAYLINLGLLRQHSTNNSPDSKIKNQVAMMFASRIFL